MTRVPIKDQEFPTDPLGDLRYRADDPTRSFAGEHVLRAVEFVARRPMPPFVRELISRAQFSHLQRPGRPFDRNRAATLEFGFPYFDARYRILLKRFRQEAVQRKALARSTKEILPKGEPSPSERAYELLLPRYAEMFGVNTWESLRNLHTKWKQGDLYPVQDDFEPDDIDELQEKHFPAPKPSSQLAGD